MRHESLRDGVDFEPLLHDFFLEIGSPSHEWSGLRLNDGELVDLLLLIDYSESRIDEALIENLWIVSIAPRLPVYLLDEEVLLLRLLSCSRSRSRLRSCQICRRLIEEEVVSSWQIKCRS